MLFLFLGRGGSPARSAPGRMRCRGGPAATPGSGRWTLRWEGLELAWVVQGGRGQEAGVDAHRDLVVHQAPRVRYAVGGLQHRARRTGGGGQQVGHRRGRNQRGPSRWVGEQGGLGVEVVPRSVAGAAVGQREVNH
ncbi:hypothetical protein CRUP_008658 [Coryphaenoides rupestris]|nr:hypothetical protein CRUP_008658 [Coryphaenoides rupestris]